ncbi:MAG: hypothetical protein LBE82_12560, partial [Chitinophagaceae bacterium]|nr:hypothetical protein [Chitinophagaceae bacterium]
GGGRLLQKQDNLKIVVCTYHGKDDAEICKNILTQNSFEPEFTKGYVLFTEDKMSVPYLRKCLLRAKKNNVKQNKITS